MTPDQRTDLLESLRVGVPIDRAARAVRCSVAAIRSYAERDDDFALELERAECLSEHLRREQEAKEEARRAAWVQAAIAGERARAAEPEAKPASAETFDRWGAAREEALRLGGANTYLGFLLWVERRCIDGGLHPLDPQWLYHFEAFYESGKFIDVGRFGVRAGKSDSVCRAICGEVLLIERRLEPGLTGVCPVISKDGRDAADRFNTLQQVLRACGVRNVSAQRRKRAEDEAAPPVDPWTFRTAGGGNKAHEIEMLDSQGHIVEFRIYHASERAAAGFTGIAGFGDELDLWGKDTGANPADKVIDVLVSRYATQPEARLHLMSATYDRESKHARMIKAGDTPLQRVARLGERGAAKDYEDRQRLAAAIASTDPLLVGPPMPPDCTDIPCWVSNPIATIESCYAKSDGDLRKMFGLYGGRLSAAGEVRHGSSLDDLRALAERNRALVAGPVDAWGRALPRTGRRGVL